MVPTIPSGALPQTPVSEWAENMTDLLAGHVTRTPAGTPGPAAPGGFPAHLEPDTASVSSNSSGTANADAERDAQKKSEGGTLMEAAQATPERLATLWNMATKLKNVLKKLKAIDAKITILQHELDGLWDNPELKCHPYDLVRSLWATSRRETNLTRNPSVPDILGRLGGPDSLTLNSERYGPVASPTVRPIKSWLKRIRFKQPSSGSHILLVQELRQPTSDPTSLCVTCRRRTFLPHELTGSLTTPHRPRPHLRARRPLHRCLGRPKRTLKFSTPPSLTTTPPDSIAPSSCLAHQWAAGLHKYLSGDHIFLAAAA
ncbi:hypothetical protein C8R45DRAFT_1158202 [Mycena sanguinolenta]|nr:hypothetical protein C8R45DRAFT_1158202 [Mycena sanguinolenta]